MSAPEPTVPSPLTLLLLGFVAPLSLVVAAFAVSEGQPFVGILIGIAAVVVIVQWHTHTRVDAVLDHLQREDSPAPTED